MTIKVLAKIQGSSLTLLRECIRQRDSWQQCKGGALKKIFLMVCKQDVIDVPFLAETL